MANDTPATGGPTDGELCDYCGGFGTVTYHDTGKPTTLACSQCNGTGNAPPTPATGGPTEKDPYADMIAGNQESIIRVYREACTRIRASLNVGDVQHAKRILDAANTYHPMHEESWSGWPDPPPTPAPGGVPAIDAPMVEDAQYDLWCIYREVLNNLAYPPSAASHQRLLAIIRRCHAAERRAADLAAKLAAAEAGWKDAREHADQLDRNWDAVHQAAMTPIRAAVGNPDATVPEIVAAINTLRSRLAEAERLLRPFAEKWQQSTKGFSRREMTGHIFGLDAEFFRRAAAFFNTPEPPPKPQEPTMNEEDANALRKMEAIRAEILENPRMYMTLGDIDKPFHKAECECDRCEAWRAERFRPTHRELRALTLTPRAPDAPDADPK